MPKERQETLPRRKRDSSCSPLEISSVDKGNNIITMKINSCHVTAVFRAETNVEVFGKVKDILINQIFDEV